MDDVRKSLSKLKKDFKHRLGGKKRGPDRAEGNTAGERVGSPAPRVEDSTGVSQAYSTDPPAHPESAAADEDRLDDPQRKDADVDEKEVSQSRSRLDPDTENAAGDGPSREVKRASSPPPVILTALNQEPDGTWTFSPRRLCLITPLDNTGAPTVPDRVQGDPLPDENAASNEKNSSWKSTALATAKLLLRGVRDSADAFGPLKSVAGGLCFILENCEVWAPPHAASRP